MKANYTDVNLVLDNSLSTIQFREETENGLKYFLNTLQARGDKTTLSVTEFNDFHTFTHVEVDPKNVPEIKLKPIGNRAVGDALGKTIKNVGYRLAKMEEDERPSQVMVIIIVDGPSNCAAYYNTIDLQSMVGLQQEKYSWQFVFMGPDLTNAISYGIPANNMLKVSRTGYGVTAAFDSLVRRFMKQNKNLRDFFNHSDRADQDTAAGVFSLEAA